MNEPMNKTAIKNFAIWARNKLITDIQYRAGLMGITKDGVKDPLPQSTATVEFYDIGTPTPYSITGEAIPQRKKLAEVIRRKERESDYPTAYKYILEEVAYTWFNRLIAIRFMEVNDYLPSHIRVLSSESGKIEPDLVTTPFDAGLTFTAAEEETVLRLKTENKLDELFRLLFIKQCNALNAILPALFETTSDYTELLLNLSVVDQEGVVYRLVHDISEDDFNIEKGGQVEIIGWLYQYYNTEPKSAAFAKNGKITKEEIPAVTQLFTPDWIVRYMVENSLGRIFIEGQLAASRGQYSEAERAAKEKELADQMGWRYYLPEAEQTPDVRAQLDKLTAGPSSLDALKIIDPCMGSGHILVYAFDVLIQMYEKEGYSQRDAAQCILQNNLFGLDIDKRAAQLAYFAVMMKARQYDRRIFSRGIQPHVYAIVESNAVDHQTRTYFVNNDPRLKTALDSILKDLHDATEYGSILTVKPMDFAALYARMDEVQNGISLYRKSALNTILPLIRVAEVLAQKYDVVVTNPPYMASSGMDTKLFGFVKENYDDGRNDLYTVFILKCKDYCKPHGYLGMITQLGWMSLTRSARLRDTIYASMSYVNMIHLGSHMFEELSGEVVKSGAFVFIKDYLPNYEAVYVKLDKYDNPSAKRNALISGANIFHSSTKENYQIEGAPLSYWLPRPMLPLFSGSPLSSDFICRAGMQTGDNEQFIRFWYEPRSSFVDHFSKGTKWFSYNKGGPQRKWYGNIDLVVNWKENGRDIKAFKKRRLELGEIEKKNSECWNSEFYFVEGATWSSIASGTPMFRFASADSIFDIKGPTCFAKPGVSHDDLLQVIGYLNSPVVSTILEVLSPTLDCNPGTVSRLPYIKIHRGEIVALVKDCIYISKEDWDSYETSWDFRRHPMV